LNVNQAVVGLIEDWLGRSKHNNLHALSAKSQVPYSSLYRLSKGQVEPSLEATLSILSVVTTLPQRRDFIEQHFPAVFELVVQDKSFPDSSRVKTSSEADALDELMTEPLGFRLCQQLLSRAGISPGKVKELYGELGMSYCADLENKELIRFIDGKWRTDFEYSCKTFEGNRSQVISSVKTFDPETLKTKACVLNTLSESVSVEGAHEIAKAMFRCINEVQELRVKYPGNHIFVSNFVMHMIDPAAVVAEMGASK
jgi:hypothetical protein